MVDQQVLFKPSCNALNLHKSSILNAGANKTGIYYNASVLPGCSLTFSLPNWSKLGVKVKTGAARQINLQKCIYLEKYLINATQIIIFFEMGGDDFGVIMVLAKPHKLITNSSNSIHTSNSPSTVITLLVLLLFHGLTKESLTSAIIFKSQWYAPLSPLSLLSVLLKLSSRGANE